MFRTLLSILAITTAVTASAYDWRCNAPCYDWTGLYVGGYVGGAWPNRADARSSPQFNAQTERFDYNLDNSWIGGATAGYNFQWCSWVFGLENEIGYLKVTGTGPDPNSAGSATVARTKIGSWYDVLALRGGYACNCALVYAKAGVAFTSISPRVDDTFLPAFPVHASGRETVVSWALGTGLEYALCGRWTLKGEYLYLGFYNTVNSSFSTPQLTPGTWRHDYHGIHTAKVGVNYRFAFCR